TVFYTLSLHDALPICDQPLYRPAEYRRIAINARGVEGAQHRPGAVDVVHAPAAVPASFRVLVALKPFNRAPHRREGFRPLTELRSEEHTSELQSPCNL